VHAAIRGLDEALIDHRILPGWQVGCGLAGSYTFQEQLQLELERVARLDVHRPPVIEAVSLHFARVVANKRRVGLRLSAQSVEGEVQAAIFAVDLKRRYLFVLAPHPRGDAVTYRAIGEANRDAGQVLDLNAEGLAVGLMTLDPCDTERGVDAL